MHARARAQPVNKIVGMFSFGAKQTKIAERDFSPSVVWVVTSSD